MRTLLTVVYFAAALWCAGVFVISVSGQTSSERLYSHQAQIQNLERRLDGVESLKIGEQLAEIRTQLKGILEELSGSEKRQYGLYVPVALLAAGKLLEFVKPRK